ncbi:hypothetical protein HDU67_005080, partial [Dinochytrium kinnereticum]
MWAQLNASLPQPLKSLGTVFSSQPMVRREDRLKDAKTNADRCCRELQRDRTGLERKEKNLLAQVRYFASRGDLHKARVVAKQIAHFRSAADRNFEGSVMISTRAQLMMSNHKVNRAEVEAIKGIRYANIEEDITSTAGREHKYAQRMAVFEEMESIMNDGLDDVYETAENSRKRRDYFDLEADNVLREALEPKLGGGRFYISPPKKDSEACVTVHFRLYEPPSNSGSREWLGDPTGLGGKVIIEDDDEEEECEDQSEERCVKFPSVPKLSKRE